MFDELIQSLPSSVRRKAEKCIVRECDETEPGVFIAYVDVGDETFDVSLTIQNAALKSSNCDCKKASICEHKAALLLYLSKPRETKKTVVRTKRQDPLIAALADIDSDILKKWLGDLMLNNKDIRLAFELEFTKTTTLSIEDITAQTKNALKTVVKNKKNVDVNQLKKIVDLWIKIHDPIVKEYHNAVFNNEAFSRFHAAMQTCALEQERISTLSNKIPMYLADRVLKVLEPIHQLQLEEHWESAIQLLFGAMKTSTHLLKMTYLELLRNLYVVSNADRRDWLMRQLMGRYNEIVSIHPYYKKEVGEFYLKLTSENNVFGKYSASFQPIDYAFSYNMRLIELLIEKNEFSRAEKISLNEIKFHTKNNERPSYYRALITIYQAQQDDKKVLETIQRLFPYTLDYSDFRFAHDRLASREQKAAWRATALKMVQVPSKQLFLQSIEFQLLLALQENDMNRALHVVENGCPYTLILKHAKELIDQFNDSFLFAVLNRYDDKYMFSNNKQMELELSAVGHLAQMIREKYGVEKPLALLNKLKEKRKTIQAELPIALYTLLS